MQRVLARSRGQMFDWDLTASTSGGPLREIIFNGPCGGFRGGMQPVRRPRRKVAFDTLQSRLLRCMDGPQIKTHRGQKVGSELCSGIGAQLHLARISRDPAKHKTVL